MRKRAFSFVELLVVTAIVSALATILFPALSQARKSQITNRPNLENIASAAIAYGTDYDERIPILANGPYRSLKNIPDGSLTVYGEKRTDFWPLILLPYVKDRGIYQDPRRDDLYKIWTGAAHSSSDPGYTPLGATYRNQNRFPCFGVNYLFLSPMETSGDPDRGVTTSISKAFTQATDPGRTIFYSVTMRGAIPTDPSGSAAMTDNVRGFFVVNAPGMYGLSESDLNFMVFINGAPCSGDWCGNVDPGNRTGERSTNYAYIERVFKGNNVAFLDGHVQFMTDVEMTAGTNYLDAVPNGEDNEGGAVITDKKKYLWDLDGYFDGLYGGTRK